MTKNKSMCNRGFFDPHDKLKHRGEKYSRPYPWETKMTICIAAVCQQNNIPRIILCCDWKQQSEVGSSETADKFYKLADGWYALGAGTQTKIDLLVREYQYHFKNIGTITDSNIADVMRQPLYKMKKVFANEYTQSQYAISYDDFLSIGKDKFPIETYREELAQIKNIQLDASLLIVGFTGDGKEKSPNICRTTSTCEMFLEEDFAAIGAGDLLALPTFYSSEYDSEFPLTKAIYVVYEAKTKSEKHYSVGEDTAIDVLNPSGHIFTLSDKGWDRFDRLYTKYNPALKEKDFELDETMFENSEHAEESLGIIKQ